VGVAQVGRREFALAVDSLNRALEKDPGLSVAFEARASARFGLGQYREAAADYQTARESSPGRASPIWGLAECYRLLADRRAAETYALYAESGASDVVEAQRDVARKRANELRPH
jgi:Tfp pilus assembly protein PilF